MHTKMNYGNIVLNIVYIYCSAISLFICTPNRACGIDTNETFTAVTPSTWISEVYHDANGDELIAILHLVHPDKAEYSIKEYVRSQGGGANPDIWSLNNSKEWLAGSGTTISIGENRLIIERQHNEMIWPLEYHKQSVRYMQSIRDMAEPLHERIDAIGKWMSYSVNSEMWDPLIWTLAVTENETFTLQMYSYGQPAAPLGWSLMLKLVGNISYAPGALDTKQAFNVPQGSIEQWHGDTPLLRHKIELFYEKKDNILFAVFPADGEENRPNVVLTFRRSGE